VGLLSIDGPYIVLLSTTARNAPLLSCVRIAMNWHSEAELEQAEQAGYGNNTASRPQQ